MGNAKETLISNGDQTTWRLGFDNTLKMLEQNPLKEFPIRNGNAAQTQKWAGSIWFHRTLHAYMARPRYGCGTGKIHKDIATGILSGI